MDRQEFLLALRNRAKRTQADVAADLGITPQAVSFLEKTPSAIPRKVRWNEILSAYRATPKERRAFLSHVFSGDALPDVVAETKAAPSPEVA